MMTSRLLPRYWKEDLKGLISQAERELLIASPFVTRQGVDFVSRNIASSFQSRGQVTFLTDLSPLHICQKATEPRALRMICQSVSLWAIWHLPRLHAKVYVADSRRAIITSGNLTSGGLDLNYEYGVEVTDMGTVNDIRRDIHDYAALGAPIGETELATYCDLADRVVTTYQNQLRSAARAVRQEFARSLRDAEDELLRLRVAGGAITTVFEKTILYLLNRYGPMSTKQLHPLIQRIHPDLCDDTIDRVIQGQHFGKKWKHAVRRAQSHLKDAGKIELSNGVWRLTSH